MGFPYPHPLGLPRGSVRATITLLLSVDLALLTMIGAGIADKVATMTVVALTFYFGGKMRTTDPLPRSADISLRAWGLPAGTIRFLLIAIFGWTVFTIINAGGEIPDFFMEVINIILGYMGGRFFETLRKLILNEHEKTGVGILDHLKSLAVLSITTITAYLTYFEASNAYTETLVLLTAVLLGFYFGSRDHAVRGTSQAS